MNLKIGLFLQGGKYRIEKELGHGGFGVTYLAYQVNLERQVAIKEFFMKEYCIRDELTYNVNITTEHNRELVSRFRNKFIKEARCIANLTHPHIVHVIDVFEENGTAYYVMDYLGGGTLQNIIQAHGTFSVPVASDYIRQVASALDYIHDHNLLHLDVKPSNIMLNNSGEAVLVDFGVSKRYDNSGHQTSSTPLGVSEGFAPLEQYESGGIEQFSPSTDIYSLGATFYYLLTGSRPPKASTLLSESLFFPESIPQSIQACIASAMSPARRNRPQSVDEFMRLLETAVGEDELDDTVVEPKVLKSGKVSNNGKDSASSRMFLKKRVVPIAICLLVGLFIYLFGGGRTDNSGTLNDTLAIFSNKISTDSTHVMVEEPSQTKIPRSASSELTDTSSLSSSSPSSSSSDKSQSSSNSSSKGRINGHDYVDLGLPSGLKWATCNMGATCPEDYGDYYAWGEIQTKPEYTIENSLTEGKYLGNISGNSQYDAARAQWGNPWRLPTMDEFKELSDCKWKWTTVNNHEGIRITGPNGNSIFLPNAKCRDDEKEYNFRDGHYWTSTPFGDDNNRHSVRIFINKGQFITSISGDRHRGGPIRPVSE